MDVKQQHKDWLRLTLTKGIGPVQCRALLDHFSSPASVFSAESSELTQLGFKTAIINALRATSSAQLDKALAWLEQPEHFIITIDDEVYPSLLKEIYAPPPVLYAIGQIEAIKHIQFAIVGSRNPTKTGRKLAEEFASLLAETGLSICSGLALGIDYHGHVGALKANATTVAVMGNGLNSIYPAKHKSLAQQISQSGLLLSEYPPGTKPSPGNFPQRNRIISGMSVGVLVVEAAMKSGSLITAQYALEQGREVFAIPGSIHNPLAKGTHKLIKQGAKLVETVEDILEELAPLVGLAFEDKSHKVSNHDPLTDLDQYAKNFLEHMGYDDIGVDELINLSGLTADAVSSMLLTLELKGLIETRQGGKYCRCV